MVTNSVLSTLATQRAEHAPVRPARSAPHISYRQLFTESEQRLAVAASSGIHDEELIAGRLLADAGLYSRWESEHAALLGRVAHERRAGPRRALLLSTSLTLIHRKALFEYLRDSQLRGFERADFVHRVFGSHEYSRLIVHEHGNYIRSAASFICMRYLGAHVFRDALFGSPLEEYEELYAGFYDSCCKTFLLSHDDPLVRYFRETHATLKRQLALRRSILLRCALHDSHPDTVPAVDRRH